MNVIKRHWLIIGLVVVAIGILAAFKLKGGEKTSVLHDARRSWRYPRISRSYWNHQRSDDGAGRLAGVGHDCSAFC